MHLFINGCRRETAKAVEVLVKDLKVFASFNEDLFKEITMLLTLGNFRYVQSSPLFSSLFVIGPF